MTYSYSTDMGYNKSMNNPYANNKLSAAPLAVGAGFLGVGAGAIGGACKKINIINKNGTAQDSFVKTVYDKYAKNTTDTGLKEFEKQRLEIMKKIKNTDNKDELKTLINENKALVDKVLAPSGQTSESFINGMKWYSLLGQKKQRLLNGIENAYELRLDDIGNKISECWNPTTKKFEQGKNVPDELYKVIKNTKNGMKAKNILKTAGLTGLIAGVGTFALVKILGFVQNKNTNNQKTIA